MRKNYIIWCMMMLSALVVQAQPVMETNVEVQNLGQVEWKHPVTISYTVTNTGDSPLVINMVDPDCACSVARWTDTPIQPEGKGRIDVTFDAETLGHFYKSVAIHSNAASGVSYVYFDGQVLTKVTDYSRTHPYQIGTLRLDTASIVFDNVLKGQQPVMHISVANQGDTAYEPVLMRLPHYLKAEADPVSINAGERADIKVTLLSDNVNEYGLTKTSVYLSRFTGDKMSHENEIPVSIMVLPDFSSMTDSERLHAATLQLSDTVVDLSADLARKSKARYDITVGNTGEMPLYIPRVQIINSNAVSVSLKKNLLQPGETTRLRITVNGADVTGDSVEVMMITTDYRNSKVTINIKTK